MEGTTILVALQQLYTRVSAITAHPLEVVRLQGILRPKGRGTLVSLRCEALTSFHI